MQHEAQVDDLERALQGEDGREAVVGQAEDLVPGRGEGRGEKEGR